MAEAKLALVERDGAARQLLLFDAAALLLADHLDFIQTSVTGVRFRRLH